MKAEVKSLWAAIQVSIGEKKEEERAVQHAEKGGKPEGGTLTAVVMEESLEQAIMNGALIQCLGHASQAKVSPLTKPRDLFAKVLLKAF